MEGEDLLKLWLQQLASIPNKHRMFEENATDIGSCNWRLAKSPITSSSKRGAKACWENLLRNQYEALDIKSYKQNHCILHTGATQKRGGRYRNTSINPLSGYIHVAFGSEPKKNSADRNSKHRQKHRPFHCIIWLLYHPDFIDIFEKEDNNLHVAHFCHRGICANVWDHLDLVPERFNFSQNGCIFGSAITCPHRPKRCIFVDATGRPIPCFNDPHSISFQCNHEPNCFHSRLLPGITGIETDIIPNDRKRKAAAQIINEIE
jgi:hypothetical protein